MCLICDGYTEEDVHRAIELTIATYGWSVQGVVVEPPDTGPEWAYSIGLAESYGLPELVVTGLAFDVGHRLINAAADLMIEGCTLDEAAASLGMRAGVVHQRRIESGEWVGMWSNYYGPLPEPGTFVQLFAAPEMFCACHRHLVPDLTDPGPVERPGTRAARRRAEREARRRRPR